MGRPRSSSRGRAQWLGRAKAHKLIGDLASDDVGELRRHGVAELKLLIAPAAAEGEVVRECHQSLQLRDPQPRFSQWNGPTHGPGCPWMVGAGRSGWSLRRNVQ